MTNRERILQMIDLCMQVHETDGGMLEERNGEPESPCVFWGFSGQASALSIEIYNAGWRYGAKPDNTLYMYMDEPINDEQFDYCLQAINELVEMRKEAAA